MKSKWTLLGSLLALLLLALAVGLARAQGPTPSQPVEVQAALGTAFTYQGQLKKDGNPVNDTCDFQFSLWDTATGGTQIGSTQTKTGISVSNGYFTIPDLDFGEGTFTGDARWLQITVRCPAGSGSYTPLAPRQALTATPYALSLRPGAQVIGTVTAFPATIYAENTATSGYTYGVHGRSNSTAGRGVYGWASATSGTTIGVYGESRSTAGFGVFGYAGATSGFTFGVAGQSESTEGRGVNGYVGATTGTTYGVYGESLSTDGRGVYGTAPTYGVYGYATATSDYAYGVYGQSESTAGRGVVGVATATSGTTYGVYGYINSRSGFAGYFMGDVHVTFDLTVGGTKAFQIDHPLDPAGRYLYHFAQEGPEVQNVYNGVVTLDASGEAVVTLPAYFSALNAGPFRYQLTPIGAPMPSLYIAQEIQGNAFRIAGGVPGKKVSWEVTAVRNDPYVRDHPVQAEVDKPADERGTYLYPEGYGQPREMGLDYQRNADLFQAQATEEQR